MNNKAHDLSVYPFRKAEVFLIDTNVWLYLYPAPSSAKTRFARQYSKGLKAMLSATAGYGRPTMGRGQVSSARPAP